MAGREFVATAVPKGWKPGRWSIKSATEWEETKLNDPTCVTQYSKLEMPNPVPGSKTVWLRGNGDKANTEVFLTGDSAQVFVDGKYSGEMIGKWEVNGQKAVPGGGGAPGAPSAPGAPKRPQKAANLDKSPGMIEQLNQAAKAGETETLKKLLASVDPDVLAKDGKTPILIAAGKGDTKAVEALLAVGADANIAGKDGSTPMTAAFQNGHTKVLKMLFGATFQSLDSAVGPGGGAVAGGEDQAESAEDQEVPESALMELRDVTAKLAAINSNMPASASPRPPVCDQVAEGDGTDNDSSMMQEAMMKEAMRTLVVASAGGNTAAGNPVDASSGA